MKPELLTKRDAASTSHDEENVRARAYAEWFSLQRCFPSRRLSDAVATIELVPLQRPFAPQSAFPTGILRGDGPDRRLERAYPARIDSMLYERTALSKQPDALIRQELAILRSKGDLTPALLLKDPYVLDFLGLTDRFLERDLEDVILRELETFLLELGAGFSFVARQKRIQLDGDDFYIDLLFYNRKLRRLVVVELKQGSFKPEYKGQMELYLRWLAQNEREPDENLPLGIILCAGKNTEQIELLELGTAGIHVAEYLTVLPPAEILREKLHQAIETARARIESKAGDGATGDY